MATKKLFETAHANGLAQYLITGSGKIFLKNTTTVVEGTTTGDDEDGGNSGSSEHLTGDVGGGQAISITKLHWSGGTTIEDSAALSFTLDGNGAWSQFNGWTPVDVTGNLIITGTGTLFIEVKKVKGYEIRTDYHA